jgi:NAD(P)H-flavin reductase
MTGPAELHDVAVLDDWDETSAFKGIRLALPSALARAHQRPGQIVKVGAGEGEAFYALATAPHPAGETELLVKRGGRVADALAARAVAGAAVACSAPFGQGFPVEEAEGRDVLLFAAGSGIAPIRAVIQHVARHRARFNLATLFYGQRRQEHFAYVREHVDWERAGIRVVLCPSGEDDAWQGVRGRVQQVARTLGFGGARPGDVIAFVAGMTAMVDDVRLTLAGAGVPPERVHVNF